MRPPAALPRQGTGRPPFDLHGKTALVTGGGRGIGRGVALALARGGADVAVNFAVRSAAAEAVARDVEVFGGRAMTTRADVSSRADVERMVEEVTEAFGRVDVLVNNAGILDFEPFLEMKESTWDRLLAVNLKGQFLVGQSVARRMVEAGRGGRIVNVASIASGQVGIAYPGIAHYVASKGGVVALTEAMALELAKHQITVNAIAPGFIATDMTAGMSTGAAAAATLARIPLGRAGTPEDVGGLAAFLASDESSYCTGGVFYVDGGWLAG